MEAWDNFLNEQEELVGTETVQKWLRPLKVMHFDAQNLYLQAGDSFQIAWFEEHFRSKVNSSFLNNNRRKIKVHISLGEPQLKTRRASTKAFKPGKDPVVMPLSQFTIDFDPLNPHSTFDTFVNSSAHPLAGMLLQQMTGYKQGSKSIPQIQAVQYNPIYLHGIAGTGKTHLLMATAHAFQKQGLSVAYVRAETFTDHVVTAIRACEMNLFRNIYRGLDVLIIDDVHLLGKKWATQEELFHTFNALHLAGKQIILSANCLPSELQFIEPRLISRFEWGIVLPVEPLLKEERALLLDMKTKAFDCAFNSKVTEFLLDTFKSQPAALCRAIEALILRLHLHQSGAPKSTTQLTVTFVQHQLSDLIHEELQGAVTPEKIIQHISEFYGIRPEDILGKAQSRDCVLPRQMAMYLCRNHLKMPYTKIGDIFSKDHSTVMTSVKVVQKGLENNDADIAGPMQTIVKNIQR